jgi:transposase-like protein
MTQEVFVMAGKKGMKHYSREVKLEAVRLYEEEGKSQAEIIKALGIKGTGRVKRWLHQYRECGLAAFEKKKSKDLRGRRPKRENTEAYIARLEMEVDLLKKFHAELRKEKLVRRNIGLSTTKKKDTQ